MWPTPDGWVCVGGGNETGSEASSEQDSPATSRSGGSGPEVTLRPVHILQRVLPSYAFPPPYTAGDVTMPYDDHREMVDPTWVAHP